MARLPRSKYSDLMIDRLRLDLSNIDPEDEDRRWDITKQELGIISDANRPSRLDVGYICLLIGIALGVYGVKWFPNTKFVKQVRYIQEAFKAQRRLTKVMIEEYHRLDEAIETEEQFLNMMGQDLPLEVKLRCDQEGSDRKIHMEIKSKKDKKSGNES